MSQKLPPWWDRTAGKDLRGTTAKRHIKRCWHRVDRREAKALLKAVHSGKDESYQRRLRMVADKVMGIHADYAEAAYYSYQVCPDGYGDSYLADREDAAVEAVCRKYGLSVVEVEREVMRLCYEGALEGYA